MKISKSSLLAVTTTLLLTLSACGGGDSDSPAGGGGGGGGNSAPVEITAANAKDVAGHATAFLDMGMSSSGQAAQVKSGSGSARQARASFSFNCEHGGTFSIDGGDDDEVIEVGDFVELKENACADTVIDEETQQPYIETTTSTMRIEISQVTSQTDLSFNMTFDSSSTTNHGHSDSAQGSGTFSFSVDGSGNYNTSGSMQVNGTIDGESFTVNPMTFTFNQTGNQYSYDYNVTASGSAIDGSFTAATNPPFTGTVNGDEPSNPTAGKLTITGGNSSIILDAGTGNPDTVLMTINENGTVTSEEINWSELEDPDVLS